MDNYYNQGWQNAAHNVNTGQQQLWSAYNTNRRANASSGSPSMYMHNGQQFYNDVGTGQEQHEAFVDFNDYRRNYNNNNNGGGGGGSSSSSNNIINNINNNNNNLNIPGAHGNLYASPIQTLGPNQRLGQNNNTPINTGHRGHTAFTQPVNRHPPMPEGMQAVCSDPFTPDDFRQAAAGIDASMVSQNANMNANMNYYHDGARDISFPSIAQVIAASSPVRSVLPSQRPRRQPRTSCQLPNENAASDVVCHDVAVQPESRPTTTRPSVYPAETSRQRSSKRVKVDNPPDCSPPDDNPPDDNPPELLNECSNTQANNKGKPSRSKSRPDYDTFERFKQERGIELNDFGDAIDTGDHEFQYSKDGQLKGHSYTTTQIKAYVDYKIQEAIASESRVERPQKCFRMWIQNSPAMCKGRLDTYDNKCRWHNCPQRESDTILAGWHRVAFDEFPSFTKNGSIDPLKPALVLHLDCFEKVFSKQKMRCLYNEKWLKPEFREKLGNEDKNFLKLNKESRSGGKDLIKKWMTTKDDESLKKENLEMIRIRDEDAKEHNKKQGVIRITEGSSVEYSDEELLSLSCLLSLWNAGLYHRWLMSKDQGIGKPGARAKTRNGRNEQVREDLKGTCDYHLGNLERIIWIKKKQAEFKQTPEHWLTMEGQHTKKLDESRKELDKIKEQKLAAEQELDSAKLALIQAKKDAQELQDQYPRPDNQVEQAESSTRSGNAASRKKASKKRNAKKEHTVERDKTDLQNAQEKLTLAQNKVNTLKDKEKKELGKIKKAQNSLETAVKKGKAAQERLEKAQQNAEEARNLEIDQVPEAPGRDHTETESGLPPSETGSSPADMNEENKTTGEDLDETESVITTTSETEYNPADVKKGKGKGKEKATTPTPTPTTTLQLSSAETAGQALSLLDFVELKVSPRGEEFSLPEIETAQDDWVLDSIEAQQCGNFDALGNYDWGPWVDGGSPLDNLPEENQDAPPCVGVGSPLDNLPEENQDPSPCVPPVPEPEPMPPPQDPRLQEMPQTSDAIGRSAGVKRSADCDPDDDEHAARIKQARQAAPQQTADAMGTSAGTKRSADHDADDDDPRIKRARRAAPQQTADATGTPAGTKRRDPDDESCRKRMRR